MAITRTTWTDGSTVINNARLQAIYDAIELNYETDSYTPTMTGSGSNPSSSSTTGAYLQMGDLVMFEAVYTINATGSGNLSMSLPVTAASASFQGDISVTIVDVSAGGTLYNCRGYVNATGSFLLLQNGSTTAGNVTHTSPLTLASGDIVKASGHYFAA